MITPLKKRFFSFYHISLLIVIYLLLISPESYSQRSNSYSFFQLIYSGKKKKQGKQYEIEGSGWLTFKDSTFNGKLLVSGTMIQLESQEGIFKYNFSDNSLTHILMEHDGQRLGLIRLKNIDNKLWRLLKDTLGVKIYDKNISYKVDGNNIDYNSLLFERNNRFYEAVTFWVTSTKRNVIKIINQLLGLRLNPKSFDSKEDIMNKIIYNDKSIYSKN